MFTRSQYEQCAGLLRALPDQMTKAELQGAMCAMFIADRPDFDVARFDALCIAAPKVKPKTNADRLAWLKENDPETYARLYGSKP